MANIWPLGGINSIRILETKLKSHLNSRVILGIRPEHIVDSSMRKDKCISKPRMISIDVVEPIGNEIFVYLSEGSNNFCMRVPSDHVYKPGQTIQIGLVEENMYFFDPTNETRLA